jgi:RNA polymerase sigma-70 factor, ECF subfamily
LDTSVVEQARQGSREAYEQLARQAAHRLFPVAFRILRDRDLADDALQSALMAIWRELPKLRDPARFEAWSYRLLVRFCTDELRRRRRLAGEVTELALSDPRADRQEDVANRDQLERAFRRLSAEHRAVVVLTYYRGMSTAETASALGISAGTVASRLHYALRGLRAALEADARLPLKQVEP